MKTGQVRAEISRDVQKRQEGNNARDKAYFDNNRRVRDSKLKIGYLVLKKIAQCGAKTHGKIPINGKAPTRWSG